MISQGVTKRSSTSAERRSEWPNETRRFGRRRRNCISANGGAAVGAKAATVSDWREESDRRDLSAGLFATLCTSLDINKHTRYFKQKKKNMIINGYFCTYVVTTVEVLT